MASIDDYGLEYDPETEVLERGNTVPIKLLVLTRDSFDYQAAFYQADFLNELAVQAECFFYGPGLSEYSSEKNFSDVLRMCPFEPDAVVMAHSFLADAPNSRLNFIEAQQLRESRIPLFAVINKEYSRLREKLLFFEAASVRTVFTHHHDLGNLMAQVPVDYRFFPFAYNAERFSPSLCPKRFDFGFAGLLQNPSYPESQLDTRKKIQDELFFTYHSIPLLKRKKYRHIDISWNTWSGNRVRDLTSGLLGHGRKSSQAYVETLRSTRVWLNTPSPLGLVSTRYFECMASGSVVLAQSTPALETIFPRDLVFTFEDPAGFSMTLLGMLEDSSTLEAVAVRAQEFVQEFHTWEKRVREFLGVVSDVASL